jgi:transglutaminase-like putative cysteine protease
VERADATGRGPERRVGCELTFHVLEPSLLAFQIAPATTAGMLSEEPFEMPGTEVAAEHGGRVHLVEAQPGEFKVIYSAVVRSAPPAPPVAPSPSGDILGRQDAIVALRQSRYCPSDALTAYAAREFADHLDAETGSLANQVASWVFERIEYLGGSSGPLDTAVDTLLSGQGVCRDFAHLTIALCRALGIPARLAAVYAPGLSPMDFHAVVEVLTPLGWHVVDATRLAPRDSLVRVATGRDAADTAFATTVRGDVELLDAQVFASSEDDLAFDDHVRPVSLA